LVELQTQSVAEVPIGHSNTMANASVDFAPDGRLYGFGDVLRVIDPNTGASQTLLTKVSGVPLNGTILWDDIAFHPNGTLYLVILRQLGANQYQNEFYTLDMKTGVATEVCHVPAAIQCIDFSPTGVLYGEFVGLCIIDLVKQTITPVGQTTHENRVIYGMDFAADGFIYGVDAVNRLLCKIDPSTGEIVHEYGPFASDLLDVATRPLLQPR
jgi:hypothetical protein